MRGLIFIWIVLLSSAFPAKATKSDDDDIEMQRRYSYQSFNDGPGTHTDEEGPPRRPSALSSSGSDSSTNIPINFDALPEIGSELRSSSPTHHPIHNNDPMIRDMYDDRHLQDPTHQRRDICCYLAGISMAFEVIFTISYLLYHASGTKD